MQAGLENTQRLVGAGGKLMMRLYGHPQPTVIAVTGHALAAGALITLSCDTRIAGDGPAKIGLNETAIGMGLPIFALELAKARLATSHLGRSTIQAEIYDPAGALAAGYVDQVVPAADVERIAIEEARRLGQLPNSAYRFTKLALRRELIDHVLATIDDDMVNMTTPR
jgi:enoyl-CoA hydratase